jgi:hypothetical protein
MESATSYVGKFDDELPHQTVRDHVLAAGSIKE